MSKTILIVDDEGAILRSLRRLLRRQSWVILMAESGEEALDLLAQHDVQVILTDFRMPNMTGGELLSRVNLLYPEIVGLVLSGFAEFKAVVEAFDEGFIYKFLTKPWDESALLSELHQAFQVQSLKVSEMDLASLPFKGESSLSFKMPWMLDRSSFVNLFSADLSVTHDLIFLEFYDHRLLQTELQLDSFSFIRYLAEQIDNAIPADALACHWGGASFLVANPVAGETDANEVAQGFRQLISDIQVHLRLGMSHQMEGDSFAVVYLRAREHLRGEEKATPQDLLDSSLISAFDKDSLRLVYQPIVDSETGTVVAVEAFIRGQHSGLTQYAPLEIVSSLCKLGFADILTSWVITQAAKVHETLSGNSSFLGRIVINLSLWQLESPSLIPLLKSGLDAAGMTFDQLRIDLSEDSLLNSQSYCVENIAELNRLGCQLTLDDLGTAYGLLASGRPLPLSMVKIDRSFVKDLDAHSNFQEMLLHISDLIRDRGLSIGFEGIETSEQFNFLSQRMVFEYQGNLVSGALSSDDLVSWLQAR